MDKPSKNEEIKKKLKAFEANGALAQFIVTMNLEGRMDEVIEAIKSIPTVEIPETDLTETNDILKEVIEGLKDNEVKELLQAVLHQKDEPVNVTVTLDLE